jgi:DNA-binding protein YbaB
MGKFQDMQKLLKLRKEAKAVQKKLKNMHIEADEQNVTVTISGEQKVVKVEIRDDSMDAGLKKQLEETLIVAFNKAIEKSQQVAADNMKDIMAEFGGGLPGLDEMAA